MKDKKGDCYTVFGLPKMYIGNFMSVWQIILSEDFI